MFEYCDLGNRNSVFLLDYTIMLNYPLALQSTFFLSAVCLLCVTISYFTLLYS